MNPLPAYRAGDIPGGTGSPLYGPPSPRPGDGNPQILQGLLRALTPQRSQQDAAQGQQLWQALNSPQHQSLGNYLAGEAHSLDPRTLSGAASLASLFTGRFMPKAEMMNAGVKAMMPSRTQQQLNPGYSVGGLFSGSGTTNRDAFLADLLVRGARRLGTG